MTEINRDQEIERLQARIAELENLNSRFLSLTNTTSTNVTLETATGYILHKGEPPGLHECRECKENKDSTHFGYYKMRVDKYGYLSRVNAVCCECAVTLDTERKNTLDTAKKQGKIPPQPTAGSICPGCTRPWGSLDKPRNWHRDHDAIKNEFRGWLCGDCNMAKHDHRHGKS
jgi:hypothetical protein